jgi:hypothetical protein
VSLLCASTGAVVSLDLILTFYFTFCVPRPLDASTQVTVPTRSWQRFNNKPVTQVGYNAALIFSDKAHL